MSDYKNKLKHINEINYYLPPLGSTKGEAFYYVPQKRTLGNTSSHSFHLIIWRSAPLTPTGPITTTQKD